MTQKEAIKKIFKILKQKDYAHRIDKSIPTVSHNLKKPDQKTYDSVFCFVKDTISKLEDLLKVL